MTKSTIEELNFLGLENNQTNITPKPKSQKFLVRRRSFKEMQGAISKINPEIIKSVLASGANESDLSTRSRSVPSSPRQEQLQIPISPSHASTEAAVQGTVPMTIFYNGTVSVYQMTCNKADEIMKKTVAMEKSLKRDESTETNLSVITPTSLRSQVFVKNLGGDLPIARRKSLQSFLEKRKERLVSTSPYFKTSA